MEPVTVLGSSLRNFAVFFPLMLRMFGFDMKPARVHLTSTSSTAALVDDVETPAGADFSPGSSPRKTDANDSEWVLEQTIEKNVSTVDEISWSSLKASAAGCCTVNKWLSRFPIVYWLPKYSLMDVREDFIAGLTVGLTVVPQGLAYAAIAEVPLEYGLCAAFMGCFAYTVFGTAREVSLGPTAVLSLMTAAAMPKGASPEEKAHYAVILSFFCGIIQLGLAVFNLGFLVNFISAPVISGFTTASAVVIMFGQVKTMTGIKFVNHIWTPSGYKATADSIWEIMQGYVLSIRSISGWDTLMGVVCLTTLLLMKEIKLPQKPPFGISKRIWAYFREAVRTLAVMRYALVIITATAVSYCVVGVEGFKGLSITNDVKRGVPPFGPPSFAFNNKTASERIFDVLPSVPMMVLVGALESMAVAKAFSVQFQYRIEPTQEMFALGLSNLMCSFFHGFAISGSFIKSALKAQSGVKTPLSCLWTAALVILAMTVFSPAFKYVPKSALSAMIIAAILILFEFRIFKDLWLINKKELLPICTVLIVSFTFTVDVGILAGMGVSMLLLLYHIAHPVIFAHFKQAVYRHRYQAPSSGKETVEVNVIPQGTLFFPSAESFRDFFYDKILQPTSPTSDKKAGGLAVSETEDSLVFDGIHLTDWDYTTLQALRSIVIGCNRASKSIRFVNMPEKVLKIVIPKEMQKDGPQKPEQGQKVCTLNIIEPTAAASTGAAEAARNLEVVLSGEASLGADYNYEKRLSYGVNLV